MPSVVCHAPPEFQVRCSHISVTIATMELQTVCLVIKQNVVSLTSFRHQYDIMVLTVTHL